MAWNGGVSLAVWMGGVAVELDAARRARPSQDALPPTTRGTHALYAAIGRAFDRALVVDILTGASAGGINGALLAGAIANGRRLEPDFLRRRWLELGDFDRLLEPLDVQKPTSLMRGDYFREQLLETFEALIGERDTPAEVTPAEVLLDVEMTDVVGEQRSFVDAWGETLYARQYRTPVRFRATQDYQAATLAAAARASASFPVAFQPQRVDGEVARLAGFPGMTRWAIDGGVLENAPIAPAIALIPMRPATTPVARFVCYVNAAPAPYEEIVASPAQPDLKQVLGYVITLPREGRAVEELTAIEDATRRGGMTGDVVDQLLDLPPGPLTDIASALLPTYQRRRALLSLDELLVDPLTDGGPGAARVALADVPPTELPWIPEHIAPAPAEATQWRWGVRAAQRVVALELDVLRRALLASPLPSDADVVFGARPALDHALGELERTHDDFVERGREECRKPQVGASTALPMAALAAIAQDTDVRVWHCVVSATDAFYGALRGLSADALRAIPSRELLFGPTALGPQLDDAGRARFLERALAVEVVRRSFADDFDIEAGQRLRFAQITPETPTLLFAGADDVCPRTAADKLTGIRLGHFSAFYRASWRANDFMWGRLDAAARVVELLIDPARAHAVRARTGVEPAQLLADALVPAGEPQEGDGDRHRLLWEALPYGAADPVPAAAELRRRLVGALRTDLDDDGHLTRRVCAVAAQYEVLREEAPKLESEAQADRRLGAYCTELKWKASEATWPVIESLRGAVGDKALPRRLGRDDGDESTSTLALRTIAHAMLVTLSAAGTALPVQRLLTPARVPLFAIEGATGRRRRDRLAAVVVFAGAAWYLTARWLTIPHDDASSIPLGALWAPQVLALWVAILAVVGIAIVPAVRAVLGERTRRRVVEGLLALVLLAGAGGVALIRQWATNGTAEALTAWHATYLPPELLLWVVAILGGLQVGSMSRTLGGLLAKLMGQIVWGHVRIAALVVAAVAGLLGVLSMWNVIAPALVDGGWEAAAAWAALAAPVLLALSLVLGLREDPGPTP